MTLREKRDMNRKQTEKLVKKIQALKSYHDAENLSFDFDWLTLATTKMDLDLISLLDNFTIDNLESFKFWAETDAYHNEWIDGHYDDIIEDLACNY